MNRRVPLIEGEAYHIFNRGAHKEDIFRSDNDYQRLLMLLYLANSSERVNLRNIQEKYKGLTFVGTGGGCPLEIWYIGHKVQVVEDAIFFWS